MTDLPPLPEPGNGSIQVGRQEISLGYDAEQMRAYAEAAIKQEREECAKVCDALAEGDALVGDTQSEMASNACATEIRSRSSVSEDSP